jgi:hypothetical protein
MWHQFVAVVRVMCTSQEHVWRAYSDHQSPFSKHAASTLRALLINPKPRKALFQGHHRILILHIDVDVAY